MKKYALFITVLIISLRLNCQVVVPFEQRFSATEKGGITFLSNASIMCDGTGIDGLFCPALYTQSPPYSFLWSQNNGHGSDYIDIDADPATFSSSADSLTLPDCSDILFAEIYWGANRRPVDLHYSSRDTIEIDINGEGYSTIVADTLIDNTAGYDSYHCRADITSLLSSAPNNSKITVANVYSELFGVNNWAGWNIVIVYKSDLETMKFLTVYDGLANVHDGVASDITIDGFTTPASGPVNFEIGVFVYDGDRGFVGDELLFDGGSGFVNIGNFTNPLGDVFNTSFTNKNVISLSQDPVIENNISIDADIFAPDNSGFSFIGNSETSAQIRLDNGGESVISHVVTLAIDVYKPDVRTSVMVADLNGGDAEPGDTLKYTIKTINIGSDPSANTVVTDTLEPSLEYVPESIEIIHGPNSGTKTDDAGDDQGEFDEANNTVIVRIGTGADAITGGEVLDDPLGTDSTVFTFCVVITENCVILSCDDEINNSAFVSGIEPTSGIIFNNESSPGLYDLDGCPTIGATATIIETSPCVLPNDSTVVLYCYGVEFPDFPYDGYDFYDDVFTLVDTADGIGTYYAIQTPYIGCSDTIEITIDAYGNAPTASTAGEDQTICNSSPSTELEANSPIIGEGTWTVIAGTGTFDDDNDPNTTVSGLSIGTNTFAWTIINDPCPVSSQDEISVIVVEEPSMSLAGEDQSICADPGATLLDANNPDIGVGIWTVISGDGTVTDPTAFNSEVTGLSIGENTIRWTISNGVCPESFDDIIITVDEVPTTASAGLNQTICIDPGTSVLDGNDPVIGTGEWTVLIGGGTVTDPSAFNSEVTSLTVGENTFVWTITNGACLESTDEISITIDDIPTTASAGPDQELCAETTSILNANEAIVGAGIWTIIDGDGSLSDPSLFNSIVTDLSVGTNTFRWTISSGTCGDSFDEITIILYPDTDTDGICDNEDADDDNDGVPDDEEGDGDSDEDGVLDSIDLDSDNDGVPDLVEAGGTDINGDGIVDDLTDTDGDGVVDLFDPDDGGTPLPNPDSDGDGYLDFLDLDSDNDGTQDIIEAGGVDLDGDGRIDGYSDIDGDGYSDLVDTDDNTIPGPGDGGIALSNPDSDEDGLMDRIDRDSDNDGIPDITENGGSDSDGNGILDDLSDVDSDGFADLVDTDDNTIPGPSDGGTNLNNGDADMDGISNSRDLDSDNDGILDILEGGGVDSDNNGVIDDFEDDDNDGLANIVDTDDGGTAMTLVNTDGISRPNYLDIDSDNDGIIDNVEGQSTFTYNPATGIDSDGDGIDNSYDIDSGGMPIIPIDTDSDGIPDYIDLNADNDAESDAIEGWDIDGDGSPDIMPSGLDSDNDGLDDALDLITLDFATAFTNAANGTINPLTDDIMADFDSPDLGDLDYRDTDTDGDGIPDIVDIDRDNDGIPDALEDLNEDGDGNPYTAQSDSDGDGISDIADLDSDNDGIPDIVEAGGIDFNADGKVDDLNVDGTLINDSDNNGLDDFYDSDNGGENIPNPDTDSDGNPDFQDLDSDNDGIFDHVEEGGADVDNDGRVDDWADEDEDGIPNYADVDETGGSDFDGDGIDDLVQIGDDLDGDNITNDFDNDANGDGWDDDDQLSGLNDTDGDGDPDRIDLDSDNDEVPDIEENDPNLDGSGPDDTDGDGIPDFQDDNDDDDDKLTIDEGDEDGDGFYDDCDLDGIPDYLDPDPCNSIIPTGFSPNNDGVNDFFVIGGIEDNPNVSLTIINRWGSIVYQSSSYQNDWDGTNQKGMTTGSRDLPVGTYFYIIDFGDGSDIVKNYLQLQR